MKETTIKISKETKDMLDLIKVHPRQSYEEVVRRLIKEGWELMKLELEKKNEK